MIYGDAAIEEVTPGNRIEIPVSVYNEMVINTLNEVEPIENDILNDNRKEARRLLAGAEEFKNHTIAVSDELEEALKSTHNNTDEIISSTGDVRVIHILEHFDRLEAGRTGDNKVGAEVTPEPPKEINLENYRGTVSPEVRDVVTPVIETLETNVERNRTRQEAISAYVKEGMDQGLNAAEANRYAKDKVDSMGDNIVLPK